MPRKSYPQNRKYSLLTPQQQSAIHSPNLNNLFETLVLKKNTVDAQRIPQPKAKRKIKSGSSESLLFKYKEKQTLSFNELTQLHLVYLIVYELWKKKAITSRKINNKFILSRLQKLESSSKGENVNTIAYFIGALVKADLLTFSTKERRLTKLNSVTEINEKKYYFPYDTDIHKDFVNIFKLLKQDLEVSLKINTNNSDPTSNASQLESVATQTLIPNNNTITFPEGNKDDPLNLYANSEFDRKAIPLVYSTFLVQQIKKNPHYFANLNKVQLIYLILYEIFSKKEKFYEYLSTKLINNFLKLLIHQAWDISVLNLDIKNLQRQKLLTFSGSVNQLTTLTKVADLDSQEISQEHLKSELNLNDEFCNIFRDLRKNLSQKQSVTSSNSTSEIPSSKPSHGSSSYTKELRPLFNPTTIAATNTKSQVDSSLATTVSDDEVESPPKKLKLNNTTEVNSDSANSDKPIQWIWEYHF